MKKFLILGIAAAAMVTVAGCRWCNDPQPNDPSCIKESHEIETTNFPPSTNMVTPHVAVSREVFRPVFRAGAGRLTVVGSGCDRKNATHDAIAKFLEKANCDYIVAVSTVTVKKDHPKPWWDFICWCKSDDHTSSLFPFHLHPAIFCGTSTNYKVTISGIPIYLERLSVETLHPDKVDAYDAATGLYLPSRGHDKMPQKAVRMPAPTPLIKGCVEVTKIPVRVAVSEGPAPAPALPPVSVSVPVKVDSKLPSLK